MSLWWRWTGGGGGALTAARRRSDTRRGLFINQRRFRFKHISIKAARRRGSQQINWLITAAAAYCFCFYSTFNSRTKNYTQEGCLTSASAAPASVVFGFAFGVFLSCLLAPFLFCDWGSLSPPANLTLVWKRFAEVPFELRRSRRSRLCATPACV